MNRSILSVFVASTAIVAAAQSTTIESQASVIDRAAFKIEPLKNVQLKSRADAPDAWYMPPIFRLFHGFDKIREYYGSSPIEVYPPDVELEWYNLSDNDNATYAWKYFDIDSENIVESSYTDLSLTYPLDKMDIHNTIDGMEANGLLIPGVSLTAVANGESATYESCGLMQIGGSGIVNYTETGDKKSSNLGLLPFGVESDGLMTYTQGDNVPVFGYSPASDQWLTNMVFNGSPDPGEYVYCNAIFNTIIPTEAPLTVRGARFFGRGKLNDDAVLSLLIYPTTEEGEFVTTPIAEVECPVSEMIVTEDGDANIYEVPFVLPNEIELCALQSPYYLVGISGFHGAAEWFAPYQSAKPNEYELALGYYRCTVDYNGQFDDWYMWHVANFTNDEGQDLYSTFAICLDAAYPWIKDPWTTAQPAIATDAIANDKAYDLQGRPVRSDFNGVIVKGGKKEINQK